MILDLLSSDMYISYNVQIANKIGLEEAIYISELININRKAIQKNKIEDGYFNIDRKYITNRTTFKLEKQIEIDQRLQNLNIIDIGVKSNNIKLNIDTLTGILLDKNEKLVETITTNSLGKKMTKKEAIAKALKTNIETNNEDLINAYSEWIDAILTKFGWMSKKAITEGQKRVDEYSRRDLDVALEIIKIATINGYKDIEYAISTFERKFLKKFEQNFHPIKEKKEIVRTTFSDEEVF